MTDDVRRKTRIINRRGVEYLVGTILYSTDLRWSRSPYDAWGTRKIEQAEKLAKVVGGDLWLFNPIVGQLKELRRKER